MWEDSQEWSELEVAMQKVLTTAPDDALLEKILRSFHATCGLD